MLYKKKKNPSTNMHRASGIFVVGQTAHVKNSAKSWLVQLISILWQQTIMSGC